jgi:pyrroloquinoline quinone biosynthesis protein D
MADVLDLQLVPCIAPGYRMQWEEVQSCKVLLYPEGMVQLNETASLILEQCDGERTLAQIIADLEAEFAEEGLRDDVLEFMNEAVERGWLRVS